MRIYLPATVTDLADPIGLTARLAHAVTPALRQALPGESEEDLEVPAFYAAADASVALLDAQAVPARVVVAADVPHAAAVAGEDVTVVAAGAVPWSVAVSIHVDDPNDPAVAAILTTAIGTDDDNAHAAVDDLDLLWYDISERADIVAAFGR